ncbi:hypothetical protein [Nodosilinea sp. E11]|nr:hypothetical protein [Nodosilinea sp. E11]WOD37018.1 hypothetical protein RRF56_00725 [Nodosilinea sp. E11]
MLMGSDDTAIDKMNVPIELAFGIDVRLEGREYLLPQADLAPVVKPPGNS